MSNIVNEFCESVQAKIKDLDGRIDLLKLNYGTTWHSLREKLDEVRQQIEARQQEVSQARSNLAQWASQQEGESTILQWIHHRETVKLIARAQKAEDYARLAMTVAAASIDDAERMILEAVSALRDAQAVTDELNRDDEDSADVLAEPLAISPR
jgi:DNA repair exonuclease SbcCD ATPase subunit